MPKKNSQIVKKSVEAVNHSLAGYEAEEAIARAIRALADVPQKYSNNIFGRTYEIDKSSICTGLKLRVAGTTLTENDVNFLMKRKSRVVRSLNKFFLVTDTENVALQSKFYNKEVAFEKVNKDIIHALMTHNLGFNLKANTVVITQSRGDFILESKLKAEYNVRIVNADSLSKYEVRHILGDNTIAWRPFEESSDNFVNKNLSIGKLTLLDDGHSFWKGLKLANFIYVDCIGNEEAYESVRAPLHAMNTYLNPEYYGYLATSGVDTKSARFLSSVNARSMVPADFYSILRHGAFFSEFKKLKFDYNFGYGKVVAGQIEQELKDRIDSSVSDLKVDCIDNSVSGLEFKLLSEGNIKAASGNLLNERSYARTLA
ncbi:MAG TPA: hypothetical protein VI790_04030 [Candidatus Nanoarchaeia archaeon]|nr:hypothetical protein [Candidatus Nanoarchaeia archaeon]